MADIKSRFIGRWNLESVTIKHGDSLIYPFGKDLKAILFYDEEFMSVQIMMPHEVPIEDKLDDKFKLRDLAWSLKNFGYMGYFGKYEIDEANKQVIHHVEGSIAQNIVGGKKIRNYRFENGKMMLSTGPMELTWNRKNSI